MTCSAPRSLKAPLLAAVLLAATGLRAEESELPKVPLDLPRAEPTTTPSAEDLLSGVGRIEALLAASKWDAGRGRYVAPTDDGAIAELTLERELQQAMERLLRNYDVPYGAVVALDPRDGRILAMAEHSEKSSSVGLATRALYPAASVFKIVTGAALLEAGVSPETEVCYHGGLRRLELKNLRDDPRRDRSCASLASAMGKSINVIFGKLANRSLTAEKLRQVAGRMLFNQPLPVTPSPPSVGEALVSPAIIPEDELGFGRTAAGFGRVYLSPLHGALLAGAVGHKGVAVEPTLIDAVVRGGARSAPPKGREQRLMPEDDAAVLTRMLERTVTEGTARMYFKERRRNVLGTVRAAGKTGSLADKKPFKDYSWFVGFAPVEAPRVAVAAIIVNTPKWRIKASYAAREALREFFEHEEAFEQRTKPGASATGP